MGIFINGVKIKNSSDAAMVNNRIISGGNLGNSQKFNEKKHVQADNVERVTIKSKYVNVIVTASNTNVIEAHFHGEAVVDGKPMLNIGKNGREVVVILDNDGNIGDLTLTVSIPTRTFEALNVISYNGNLSVKSGVSAKKIRLDTHNGDVESEGNFVEISATTHNGDTDVYIAAKSDVKIEASSHNGNVSVELQNIATSNISTSTSLGNVRNRFHGHNSGYTAYGQAKSHNGNVSVR